MGERRHRGGRRLHRRRGRPGPREAAATRTPPSALEVALAAEVARCGLTATPFQFEWWRRQAWLAPTAQWTDPATDALRPETVHRAAWLALLSRAGRSISWIGWTFWAIDATEHSTRRLRQALTDTLQLPLCRAGIDAARIPQGDSDAAFEARQELAGLLLAGRRAIGRDLDGILRTHAAAAGLALPEPRSVSNPFDKTLVQVGARLLIGGMHDVSPEELTAAWRSLWTGPPEQIDRIDAAHIAADRAGTDLRARSPLADGLRGLLHTVETVNGPVLCAAVRACTKASATLAKLLTERVDGEPEILAVLMDDVMWDQWVRAGGLAPLGRLGKAAIALSTIQYLVVPGWAADLQRYQTLMDALLAAPEPPAGQSSSRSDGPADDTAPGP
ncbi:hypothetical protein [Streptomyces sp. NPDC087437]|uniref:hypothetical protein n=1 Tax=Streptomyces sp. NPDC087437 TaxID=3365789 RepID=UPI0038079766